MGLFNRKQVVTARMSGLSYKRWLRAQRPPFEWFQSQTEDVQEWLASMGDDYVRNVTTDIGKDAQETVHGEEAALRKMAADAAGSMMGRTSSWPPGAVRKPRAPAPPPQESTG